MAGLDKGHIGQETRDETLRKLGFERDRDEQGGEDQDKNLHRPIDAGGPDTCS